MKKAMSKPTDDRIDAVYYRDGASKKLAMRLLVSARTAMFDLFMARMAPTASTTILDIGVSDEENDGANFLEKNYPFPRNITCAGLGLGEAVKARYPGVKYQQIEPGKPLPFADKSFDIACSNAVLEHVGGPDGRAAFVAEHLRVAKAMFLTVPNRWFPIEHHTGLPLVHYMPGLFRRLLAGTRYDHWTRAENVEFIDRAMLKLEWPGPADPEIVMTGLPIGPFSSNVAVIYPPRRLSV